MTAMDIDLKYLVEDWDRHGNRRFYVRRYGRKIRLREKVGTPEFLEAYNEALKALETRSGGLPPRVAPAPHGSLGWLATAYFASTEFREGLDAKSQSTRRLVIESCLQEPLKPGSLDVMRACPISRLSAKHVLMLRDRRKDKPGAANNRIKYLSAMFGWAIEAKHLTANPARDVRPLKYKSDGFHTWTSEEVQKFEAKYPIGTKARLALALLLFTGARRGDMVTFGKQHVRDGWLRYVPRKTRYLRMTLSEKPVLPVLADIIAKSPVGDLTFLVTSHGKPFTAAGFGNWFREQCNRAGLPHCTAHGLRKAGATRLAEAGATDRQLMAIFDWTTPAQATTYTQAASRKKLAGDAMHLLAGGTNENVDCPTAIVPPAKALKAN